jgi:hypothetical protein
MTTEQKPREWWILKNPSGEFLRHEPYDLTLGELQSEIKVVEHSALVQAQERIRELEAALTELLKAYWDVRENDDGAVYVSWRHDAEEAARAVLAKYKHNPAQAGEGYS